MRFVRGLVWLGGAIYLLTLIGVVVLSQLVPRLTPDPAPLADAVVVLSSGVTPQGHLSAFSRGRTDTGIDLVLAERAPVMIVTGGPNPYTTSRIADLMARHAARRGVDPDRIRVERKARSTLQNAKFSKPLLGDADHILLVTDRFHLARSYVSFRLFWSGRITLVGTSDAALIRHAPWWEWTIVFAKEPLAIWFNLIRVPVWWASGLLGLGEETRDALLH